MTDHLSRLHFINYGVQIQQHHILDWVPGYEQEKEIKKKKYLYSSEADFIIRSFIHPTPWLSIFVYVWVHTYLGVCTQSWVTTINTSSATETKTKNFPGVGYRSRAYGRHMSRVLSYTRVKQVTHKSALTPLCSALPFSLTWLDNCCRPHLPQPTQQGQSSWQH